MATFNPYNKAIKESINVDYRDRHSPQKVILCNRENQFYGEFFGTAKLNDVDIKNGVINNAKLSNVSIYDASGKLWHLSSLAEDLTRMQADIIEIQDDISNNICIAIDTNTENIAKISNAISDVFNLSVEMVKLVDAEKKQRYEEDQKIINKYDSSISQLSTSAKTMRDDFDRYVITTIQETKELSANLVDDMNFLKHYGVTEIEDLEDGTFNVKDFNSNVINTIIPYGFITWKDTTGETVIIGKITDVEEDGSEIQRFSVRIYDDCPLKHLPAGSYDFTRNAPAHRFDDGYVFSWEYAGTQDKFKLRLVGTQPYQYLIATYSTIGGDIDVGQIKNFLSDDSVQNITSGEITFEIGGKGIDELSGFDRLKFEFNGAGDSKQYDAGKKTIVFSPDEDHKYAFLLRDGSDAIDFYQQLTDETRGEFGRIYKTEVNYDEETPRGVDSLTVQLSANIDGEIKEESVPVLSGENSYFDDNFNYITLSDNNILVKHESKYYKTSLSAFDVTQGIILNKGRGTLFIDVENIHDVKDTRISSFTVTIEDDDVIPTGSYTLTQYPYTDSKHMYAYRGSVGPGKFLALEYDTKYGNNLLNFIYVTDRKTTGYFFVDLGNITTAKDDSYTLYSHQIQWDGEEVSFPIEDKKTCKDYYIDYSTVIHIHDGDEIRDFESSSGNPTIRITIPKNEFKPRLREFNVVFNQETPYIDKFTKVLFETEPVDDLTPKYSFQFSGMDVTDGMYLVNPKSVMRFTEVDRNRFVIEDMKDDSIIHYINERLKGGVNYRGTVQLVDDGEHRTNHLSNLFFYTEDNKPEGWEYPRPEYHNPHFGLVGGNMFFVSKTESTQTTKMTIDGIELECGDYIIIKSENPVRICDITSADIDVIDTIEKDHIIVEKLTVNDKASIEHLDTSDLNSIDAKITDLTVTNSISSLNLTADNVNISSLNAVSENVGELTATKLTATNGVSALNLTADNANISTLNVLSGTVDNLTATSEIVTDISAGSISVELSGLKFINNGVVSSASDISAEFRADIDNIDERVNRHLNYKGDVMMVENPGIGEYTTLYLSNLFYLTSEDRDRVPDWNPPYPECLDSNHELQIGEFFYVGKTPSTTSTRWTLSGGNETIELEEGDYIFVKNGPVAIKNLQVSNVHVIDSIEKDKIIVDNLSVGNLANITSADIDTLTVRSETVANLTATDSISALNLTADNVNISNLNVVSEVVGDLTATNETVSKLTATDSVSALSLTSDNTNISNLTAEAETVTNLTATNETVTKLTATNSISALNLTVDNSNISSLNATTAIVSNLTATSEFVTDLTVSNVISAQNLTADYVNISNLTATSETVTGLTVTNETVKNLTATNNLSAFNLTADNTHLSGLTATTENVTNITAVSADVDKLTVKSSLSAKSISVDMDSLVFTGNAMSSMSDISSDMYQKISKNSTDISQVSGDFTALSGEYTKTLAKSQLHEDWPNCLILRDYANNNDKYVLRVINGMLAITKLDEPSPIF